jgi:hypothetical protein
MLSGLERVSWVIYHTSTQESLLRKHYSNGSTPEGTDEFVKNLVSLYKEILKFLYEIYKYYKSGAFSMASLSGLSALLIDFREFPIKHVQGCSLDRGFNEKGSRAKTTCG